MSKWKELVWFLVIAIVSVSLGLFSGYKVGFRNGTQILEQEHQRSLSWQYAAEHYGGICKWFLENKPIYGAIEMGDGTTLSDCLIVSGSSEASVVADGDNILIANNHFRVIDMDWIVSITAIDPNEFEVVEKLDWGAKIEEVDIDIESIKIIEEEPEYQPKTEYARKALLDIDERYSNINYGQFTTTCDCGNFITSTYIEPYYWFICSKCNNTHTNTDCKTVQEFYDLVGFKN